MTKKEIAFRMTFELIFQIIANGLILLSLSQFTDITEVKLYYYTIGVVLYNLCYGTYIIIINRVFK